MTPPYAHWQVAPIVSAGLPPMRVCVAPFIHGATVAGMHGMGVSTPSAAAVAAATVGLARLVHMPKGGMFAPGTMSVIAAAGLPSTSTRAERQDDERRRCDAEAALQHAVAVAAGLPIGSSSLLVPSAPTASAARRPSS